MPLFVVGLNHRTAPLAVRERFAFAAEALGDVLAALSRVQGVSGAVLLSTCNRTELYAESHSADPLIQWCAQQANALSAFQQWLYVYEDVAVVKHAAAVAAGLDSMVLGEPQIFGQMKESVRAADAAHTLTPLLHRAFQSVFTTAKAIRSETGIGEGVVSMAATAVKLAQQVFGSLSACKLLLIGVGEMTELAASHFGAAGVRSMTVANRSMERGQQFASRLGVADVLPLTSIADRLAEFDLVVSATAATLPIIGKGLVERALKIRRRVPIFFVDFAVPRDIEPEVVQLADVFLYTVDDLGRLSEANAQARAAASLAARHLIEKHAAAFVVDQQGRANATLIVQLRERADLYRIEEMDRAMRALQRGERPEAVLEQLSVGLMNKLIHHPTQALRGANVIDRPALSQALEKLYPLGAPTSARDDDR